MDSSGAEVARFEGVILREDVLHSEVPLNGIRLSYQVGNVVRGRGARLRGRESSAGGTAGQRAVSEEIGTSNGRLTRRADVLRGGKLRRQSEQAQVIE